MFGQLARHPNVFKNAERPWCSDSVTMIYRFCNNLELAKSSAHGSCRPSIATGLVHRVPVLPSLQILLRRNECGVSSPVGEDPRSCSRFVLDRGACGGGIDPLSSSGPYEHGRNQ